MKKVKTMILTLLLILWTVSAGAGDKLITVKLTVPDRTWTIAVDEVYKIGNELWVIARLSQKNGVMGASVISTIKTSVEIDAPDLPIVNFIIGKTWNWENQEPYTFVDSLEQINKELETGELLYQGI